ncbi:hypothetical protein PL963_P100065 (plasmid) [Pseudomonas cerasi]|uniref:Uncharacterized protein n=1 Tax=Pseudomonas cerasi TaxID=1583341 RepID=A0A2K4W2C8_9PSED|nr:hypothetical protein PL963_P100065 [Pseudomonas cerasi]
MISLCGLQAQSVQLLEHKLWSNYFGGEAPLKKRTYIDPKSRWYARISLW